MYALAQAGVETPGVVGFLRDYAVPLAIVLGAAFAGLAAWFAYHVPRNVARMSADLAAEHRKGEQRDQVKLLLFATLMQNRASVASRDAVKAFNLIDVAFFDDRNVRDAWSELHTALNDQRLFQSPEGGQIIDRQITALLRAMAAALGFGDNLRPEDFKRVYLPKGIVEEEELRQAEQQVARMELGERVKAFANTAPSLDTGD